MQRPENIAINIAGWPHAQRSGNALLSHVPDAQLNRFLPDLREMSVAAGTVLLEQGSPATDVYFPITCVVSLASASLAGQSIDVALVGSEGMLAPGPIGATSSVFNAVVQIPGRAAVIRAQAFRALCEGDPGFRRLVEHWSSALLVQSQQIAACNAVHDVEKRLCRWLLQFNERTGLNMLPVTQEMLANMLGVQRTTVTLVAHRLKSKGILRQRRGRIELLSLNALEACACDCHQVICHAYETIVTPVLDETHAQADSRSTADPSDRISFE